MSNYTAAFQNYLKRLPSYLVDIAAPLGCVLEQYLRFGGPLICLDFSSGELIGTICANELKVSRFDSLKTTIASDIANKDCVKVNVKNLDEDISLLSRYRFLPVTDDDNRLLFLVFANSKWNVWREGQDWELKWWNTYLSQTIETGWGG